MVLSKRAWAILGTVACVVLLGALGFTGYAAYKIHHWKSTPTTTTTSLNASIDDALKQAEKQARSITVSKSSNATLEFRTVQEAIDSIPDLNDVRVVVRIGAGVYREKVTIPSTKPFVTLEGEGAERTAITWQDGSTDPDPDNANITIGVFKSATVAVEGDYFVARGVSFENSSPNDTPAVAVRVSGNKAAFHNCSFFGGENTLYSHRGLHYFDTSFIQGKINVILGNGRALFTGCHLHSISASTAPAALTAQTKTSQSDTSGFSFLYCLVTGTGNVTLGRAPTQASTVVFAQSYMDSLVIPLGWDDDNAAVRDQTVFFGEYQNYGPGASTQGRVPWSKALDRPDAAPFLSEDFVTASTWVLR